MYDTIKKWIKIIWLKLRELSPWITAVCTVLSSGWASDAVWETLTVWSRWQLGKFSLSNTLAVCFFIGCVVLLYKQKNSFFRPRTRYLKGKTDPRPHKHLMLFLSTLNQAHQYTQGVPAGLSLTDDFEKDLQDIVRLKKLPQESRITWSWEMPLRALWHHRKADVLETATIVCSEESITQVNDFLSICRNYKKLQGVNYYLLLKEKRKTEWRPAGDETVSEENGWDFESFDELSEALWVFLKKAVNKKQYRENDIIIDFTGGKKVTSVVAAMLSFNRKIKAQYVRTDGNNEVVSYDVIMGSSDTDEVGL